LVYVSSEIVLSISRRSRSKGQSEDRGSLPVLWLVIILAIFLAMFAANRFRFAFVPYRWVTFAGILIFIAGIALRWYSILHLGRFFTVDVAIAKEHKVIDSGPYKFLRHPSYTGALLAFAGFGLCLHNWIAVLAILLPVTAAFLWRISVEEQALNRALGDDYGNYAARTKRLLPFLY